VAQNNNQEQVLFKEDVVEKENIQRVDKRPGSIYSIIIFAMVFLVCYLFYPQISMVLPIPGQKLTVKTGYVASDVIQMLDSPTIVLAIAKEESKTKTSVTNDGQPLVFKVVEFQVLDVLKGEESEKISLFEYGGNGLFSNGATKKKYNVKYENASDFETGKTYLLFVNDNGETVNGKAGALIQNDEGKFTDVSGSTYSLDEIKGLLG